MHKDLLLVYAICAIMSIAACTQPTEYVILKEDTDDGGPPMADEKTAPTGLPERVGYYVLDKDNRVFGVDTDGSVEQIVPTRDDGGRVRVYDLYTVDGDIYLIEREAEKDSEGEPTGEYITHRWRQASGSDSFESIKEKGLPDKPAMEHAELSGSHYTVSIGEYDGAPISIVERPNKPTEKLHHIEAAIEIDAGLLVSVREGRGTARRPGLALYQSQHPHEYMRLRNSEAVGRLWTR